MKNKREVLSFIFVLGMTFIVFHTYLTKHYATDTFEIMYLGQNRYAIEYFLNDGRIFSCLMLILFNKMHITIDSMVIISAILGIFISTVAVFMLKNIILRYNNKSEYLAILIAYGIVFNFMYIENLYFAEAFIMSISILFQVMSVKEFIDKDKNYYIKAVIFLIISITAYQGTISFFILLLTVILLIKYKFNYKNAIIDFAKGIIAIIIGIIVNWLILKNISYITGLQQNRIGSIFNIIKNAQIILKFLWNFLINTYNMFPKGLFLIFISIELLVFSFSVQKNNYKEIFNVLIIILIGLGSAFAPHLITLSSFMTPRLMFNIGALFCCVFMYIYSSTEVFKENNKIEKILKFILIIYVIINISNYIVLLNHQKEAKKEDEKQCNLINEWIEEYEQKNNITVKYIATCKDRRYTMQYKNNIKGSSKFVSSSVRDVLSNVGIINYYTNRKLERIDMPKDIYSKYFEGKDWDSLQKEQLVFIGDTLYYCFY